MNILDYFRQFKIFDYAAFDIIVAFLGMWLLSTPLSKIFLKIRLSIPKKSWVIWALPIGIITHLLVGTMTPMTVQFTDPSGHYLLKVAIISLTVLGFRGVQREEGRKDVEQKQQ